jgi:hypothetical protein
MQNHPVVKELGATEAWLSATKALAMCRTDHFQYKLNNAKTRVRWMRRTVFRKNAIQPWTKCYRTAEAPVCQPSTEWIQRVNGQSGL